MYMYVWESDKRCVYICVCVCICVCVYVQEKAVDVVLQGFARGREAW